MPFGKRIARLRKVIKTAEQVLPNDPDIQELKTACAVAGSLQKWGTVGDGKPLQIDREESEERIREAIRAGIAMEVSIRSIVAFLQDFDALGESSEPDS